MMKGGDGCTTKWDEIWKETKKFKVLFIKYEDLKDNKEKIFREIIQFVNNLKLEKNIINEEKFLNAIKSTNFVNLKKLGNNPDHTEVYKVLKKQ